MREAPERIWIDGDETGLESFLDWTWQRGSWNRSKEGVGEVEYIRADLAHAPGWQPIETAPHETLVILGWRENGTWKQEIALASAGERLPNGYSNRWWHGQATHWMPLSEAPQ